MQTSGQPGLESAEKKVEVKCSILSPWLKREIIAIITIWPRSKSNLGQVFTRQPEIHIRVLQVMSSGTWKQHLNTVKGPRSIADHTVTVESPWLEVET